MAWEGWTDGRTNTHGCLDVRSHVYFVGNRVEILNPMGCNQEQYKRLKAVTR